MSGFKNKETFLREEILTLVCQYYRIFHNKNEYIPGDRIAYAGRVYNEKEICNLVESALDFWLTAGKYAEQFEKGLSRFLNVKHCSLTNSGSSANLLAFMALTSANLENRRIKPGDEIITVAAGFPTTVAPAIQFGAVPVFADVTIPEYNIDCNMLEEALSPKTKAVMIAHTLGNPFDLNKVREFCRKYGLWLIEDNCDALGSKYCMNGKWKYTGTIGDIGTSSFYPPHHITMGEGGAVYTNEPNLHRIINSFRDWGRDCCCPPGKDNLCSRRFDRQCGELPYGYDHKYVYSHFGYNLKVTDMQAAIGCAQLDKLDSFIAARRHNWQRLKKGLDNLKDKLILPEPAQNSEPSWFGFLLTVRKNAGFTRDQIVNYLESKGIQTRMLFAGNLVRQPCFDNMRNIGEGYRVVGELKNTNRIMSDSFWMGVYPGMTEKMIDYTVDTINEFCRSR